MYLFAPAMMSPVMFSPVVHQSDKTSRCFVSSFDQISGFTPSSRETVERGLGSAGKHQVEPRHLCLLSREAVDDKDTIGLT